MSSRQTPRQRGEEAYRQQRRFARECLLQALYQSEAGDDWEWPDERLDALWTQLEAAHEDSPKPIPEPTTVANPDTRDFIRTMLAGILQNRNALDQTIVGAASNWSISRMAAIDRNILRLAIYEISCRQDIPPVAAINEALELAKKYGDKDSPRFVNGILDRVLKERPS